jgi:hypothetical protein
MLRWHALCFLRDSFNDKANDSCHDNAGTNAVPKEPLQPSTELNNQSTAAPVPAKQDRQTTGVLLAS